MQELDNRLWRFALDFYGCEGVPAICLALQETFDIDIVHLVATLYEYRLSGTRPMDERLVAIRERLRDWRDSTVLPLRRIRRDLKQHREDCPDALKEILRNEVKRTELLAEQIQVALLWEMLEGTQTLSTEARADKDGIYALLVAMAGIYNPAAMKDCDATPLIEQAAQVLLSACTLPSDEANSS